MFLPVFFPIPLSINLLINRVTGAEIRGRGVMILLPLKGSLERGVL